MIWNVEQEELLINSVRDYPWLYNKGHTSYKDVIKKENSWQEIQKGISSNVTGMYMCREITAF